MGKSMSPLDTNIFTLAYITAFRVGGTKIHIRIHALLIINLLASIFCWVIACLAVQKKKHLDDHANSSKKLNIISAVNLGGNFVTISQAWEDLLAVCFSHKKRWFYKDYKCILIHILKNTDPSLLCIASLYWICGRIQIWGLSLHRVIALKVGVFIFLGLLNHVVFSVNNSSESRLRVKHDGSLAHFIHEVFLQNPGIQAAEANLYAQRAREVASGKPLYNPNLVAQVQYAIEDQSFLGFSQTIDWSNKRKARHAVGVANLFVARAQLRLQKLKLATEVIDALSAYAIQSKLVALEKERVRLLKNFAKLTRDRFKKGDIPRVDVDLALLALSQSITQLATVEIRKSLVLQTLRAKSGLFLNKWPDLSAHLASLVTDEEKMKQFACNYPSIIVLRDSFMSAQARSKWADRQRNPDPTLGLQGGTSKEKSNKQLLINLTLNVPMYVRNNYQAEAQAAKFDAMRAHEQYAQGLYQIKANIKTSAERYQMLYEAVQNWYDVSKEPLTEGMVLIERLWNVGEITTMDYILQLKTRVDSQIAGVELEGQEWHAWIEWLHFSGQLLPWLARGA
ncbi:MAG: TolC family protein [Legionellaceae bacterium]|nr:TolC family protein [Legionellaceae bacterium]